MAIDVKTISCSQCGSTDVNMTSETQGVCKACGAKFTVQQRIDTQNVYNEVHVHNSEPMQEQEGSCSKSEIKPEYSQNEFIRSAWIALAKEDAPIEVFSGNFDDVSIAEHQVVIDHVAVDTTYQVSVGYDRQEPYIDYETYYEDEPYITTESYYDSNTKSTRTRQVTKYKKVQKQRQVTKYKTVTDWSVLNGSHSTQSTAVVENVKNLYLDEQLFVGSFRGMKDSSASPIPFDEAKAIEVLDATQKKITTEHSDNIDRSVRYSLPGDHYRDLDWKVAKVTESTTDLYKAPEYEATITYNGKTYKKHAFPFGPMEVGGDTIENEVSLDTITGNMRNALNKKTSERRDAIEKNVGKATTGISLLTIALLAVSIILSIFVRSTALVIIAFVIAVGFFVFNTIAVKKADSAENKKAKDEIDAETSKVNAEIADYSKNYKKKQRDALDRKLSSLGLKPASADEL